MPHLPRILYLYPGARSSFIAKDIRLLGDYFQVDEFKFNSNNKKLLPLTFLKQFFYLLFHLHHQRAYIIMFGGYWSLLPVLFGKIFGKKTIIIAGGTDCVSFPSINYGDFQNPIMSWFTTNSFKFTNHIVVLHQTMMGYVYSYQEKDFNKQGLQNHITNLTTPYSVIYNGYDAEFWKPINQKTPNTFITVAVGLGSERRRILKGVDLMLQLAPMFPESSFIIVGATENDLPMHAPNIILKPKANAEQLRHYYSEASFYLQLSMSEGFPNSLCEAMLCGCVPIVSNVASMPFIVDDAGFVLMKKDISLLADLINKAIISDTEALSKKARARIANNFTENARAEQLVALINNLVKP